jgi:hypothetical protein
MTKKYCCQILFMVSSFLLLAACSSMKEFIYVNAINRNENELCSIINHTSFPFTLHQKGHLDSLLIDPNSKVKIIPGEYSIGGTGLTRLGLPKGGLSCLTDFITKEGNDYEINFSIKSDWVKIDGIDGKTLKYDCNCFVQETKHDIKLEVRDARLHDSFQFDYNYMFISTTNSYSFFSNNDNKYLTVSKDSHSQMNGFGMYYQHIYRIYDDLYLGWKTGYFLADKYYSRIVFGFNTRYYFKEKYFCTIEYNGGIGTYSNGSSHNPDGGLARIYYAIGVGLNLSRNVGLVAKFNVPPDKVYGSAESSSYNYHDKYLLHNMISFGIEGSF